MSLTLLQNAHAAVRGSRFLSALVLYASLAWGLLQVVDFLCARMGLPDWIFSVVLLFVVVALPAVVLLGLARPAPPVAAAEGQSTPATTASRAAPALLSRLSWRGSMVAIGGVVLSWSLLVGGYAGARAMRAGTTATLFASGTENASGRVLLTSFENHTPDSTIGRTVEQALALHAAHSRTIRLVSPDEVRGALRRMELDAGTRLTPEIAREVALREGFAAVLEGVVAGVGGATVITLRLREPHDGTVLATVQARARRAEDLLEAVDRSGRQLRDRMGEPLLNIAAARPLERVTTRSLAALRAYSYATAAAKDGDDEKTIRLLEDAIEADSTFAMAWRTLAFQLRNRGDQRARMLDAFTRAYALRDRLPEMERHLTVAAYHMDVTNDIPHAIAAYEAVLALSPRDRGALNNLGALHLTQDNYASAARYFRRALDQDSSRIPAYLNLATVQAALGDHEAAEATYQRAVRRFPDHDGVHQRGPELAALSGDLEEARGRLVRARDARRAQPYWEIRVSMGLGHLAGTQARFTEAEAHFREAARAATASGRLGQALTALLSLARMEIVSGDSASARRRYAEALTAVPLASIKPQDRPYLELAEVGARLGAVDDARRFVSGFDSVRVGNQSRHARDAVLGIIALESGNAAAAVTLLRGISGGICLTACVTAELARAYEAAGQPDSAIAEYRRYLLAPVASGGVNDMWIGRAHERLVALYAQRDSAAFFAARWRDIRGDAAIATDMPSGREERRIR